MVVCDRYLASSIAYGEAQGLDAAWLAEIQRPLPQPSLTIVLDIPPDGVAQAQAGGARQVRARPAAARPRARKLPAPGRSDPDWVRLDGEQDKDAVSAGGAQRRPVATRAAVAIPQSLHELAIAQAHSIRPSMASSSLVATLGVSNQAFAQDLPTGQRAHGRGGVLDHDR